MSKRLLRGVSRVIFWRYERGSWQYDILCGLILAFIFLTPKEVFDGGIFVEDKDSPKLDGETVREKTASSIEQSEF